MTYDPTMDREKLLAMIGRQRVQLEFAAAQIDALAARIAELEGTDENVSQEVQGNGSTPKGGVVGVQEEDPVSGGEAERTPPSVPAS